MSVYDPFLRGDDPVGVRTFEVTDASRERTLPVEFWYPAADAHRGQGRGKLRQRGREGQE